MPRRPDLITFCCSSQCEEETHFPFSNRRTSPSWFNYPPTEIDFYRKQDSHLSFQFPFNFQPTETARWSVFLLPASCSCKENKYLPQSWNSFWCSHSHHMWRQHIRQAHSCLPHHWLSSNKESKATIELFSAGTTWLILSCFFLWLFAPLSLKRDDGWKGNEKKKMFEKLLRGKVKLTHFQCPSTFGQH